MIGAQCRFITRAQSRLGTELDGASALLLRAPAETPHCSAWRLRSGVQGTQNRLVHYLGCCGSGPRRTNQRRHMPRPVSAAVGVSIVPGSSTFQAARWLLKSQYYAMGPAGVAKDQTDLDCVLSLQYDYCAFREITIFSESRRRAADVRLYYEDGAASLCERSLMIPPACCCILPQTHGGANSLPRGLEWRQKAHGWQQAR
jgi:hypothetical protein